MEEKFTRIVTVKVEFEGNIASADMGITDENGNSDFCDPSLRWLGLARVLSQCSMHMMDKAAECIHGDEIEYLKAIDAINHMSHEKDNV